MRVATVAHRALDDEVLEDLKASAPADSSSSDESDEESESEDAAVTRRIGIPIVVALVTALMVYAAVLTRSPGKSAMKPAWRPGHVEQTCRGIEGAKARRLFEDEDAEDDDFLEEPLRSLRPAKFNPDYLWKVPLAGAAMPYYGSANIEVDVPNSAEEAILMFHGAARNAQDYFCSLRHIVERAMDGHHDRVLLLATKYHYKADLHGTDDGELWWNGSRPFGDWRSGAAADPETGSHDNAFQVVDHLLLHLSDITKFPRLKRITLMGHSAGGQTVQRYALVSHLRPEKLINDETVSDMKSVREGIHVMYLVANPSSYAYLDSSRWIYDWNGSAFTRPIYAYYEPADGRKGWHRRGKSYGFADSRLEPASDSHPFVCSAEDFNYWNYGLNYTHLVYGDLMPYIQNHPHLDRAVHFYGLRNVVYLVGQNDTCTGSALPNGYCDPSCWTRHKKHFCSPTMMDMRCPAMLQGPFRNMRGKLYMQHLQHFFGKPTHRLFEVPGVGHQAEKLFMSEQARRALLGEDRYKAWWS